MAHFRLLAAPLAALGLALAAPAVAGEPAGLQLVQAESFSDNQLDAFAVAAVQIQEIRSDYVSRIQAAESEEQRQQLAQQATDEMVGAVEAAPGITVDEYNAIIQAAGNDPELSERIQAKVQSAGQ